MFRAMNSTNLGFYPMFDKVVKDCFRRVKLWWIHNVLLEKHNGERGEGGENAKHLVSKLLVVRIQKSCFL